MHLDYQITNITTIIVKLCMPLGVQVLKKEAYYYYYYYYY